MIYVAKLLHTLTLGFPFLDVLLSHLGLSSISHFLFGFKNKLTIRYGTNIKLVLIFANWTDLIEPRYCKIKVTGWKEVW